MQYTNHVSESPPWTSRPSRTCAASAVSIWRGTFLPILQLYVISLASKNSKLCIQKLGTWRYAKTSGKFREEKLNLNVCCREYEISKIIVSTALKRSRQKRNFTKHRMWEWQRKECTNVSRKRIIHKMLKECAVFAWREWPWPWRCRWVQICSFVTYYIISYILIPWIVTGLQNPYVYGNGQYCT